MTFIFDYRNKQNALTSENYMVWENNIKTIIDKWIATNHKLKS